MWAPRRRLALCCASFALLWGRGLAAGTCCSAERKCCASTWAPNLNVSCPKDAPCCDHCPRQLADIMRPPAVPQIRNAHSRRLAATCCDRFFEDGRICRPDYGDDCAGARRCKRFGADCESCQSYCAEFWAS
ncbi:hypothetical protein M885DRAFT_627228 [Pelagophyceae sp. CCMP2097]|nr:hypothetical protein M885DRAFT_627228 [Pelagophyceae sp. CCMP2097]